MKETRQINRRNFLQHGAIAFGAPAVLGLSSSVFGKESGPLNFGVIGTGGRGTYLLEQALKVPGVRATALCDIDQEALEKAREIAKNHKPETYTYYKKLLERKDLDAVFIATPPYLHKSMTVDTLDAGLNCYTEKPMALTVNDLEAVVKTCREARGILQVGQQLRYHPSLREAMRRIQNGELGKIGFIRSQRYADWDGPGSRLGMRWLWTIEESGDQIVEQSVHELDVLNWVMNDHPVRIAGLGGQNMIFEPEGCNICDHYGLTLEYPGDRRAVFSMIKYAPYGYNMGDRIIDAYGEKGSIDLQLKGPSTIVWRGKEAPKPEEIEDKKVDYALACIKDFFDCIRDSRKPYADAEIGQITALTALLGRKAIYERRVVTWEDLLKEGAPLRPIRG
ncbi:MAG TPA: Gfo/Idh/MocA family oxidoreductase [archaeon]|nr:Gfo/Idh/MocA family oxidoreductase [archaeon]